MPVTRAACVDWYEAVAAIKELPSAYPAYAIQRLIACGDVLAAALAAPPASAPPGLVEAVQSLVAEVETVLGWAPSWEVLTPGDVRDVKQAVDRVKAALPASPETPEQDGVRKLYEELLYQVSRKYPGESRHQTAKRMLAEHDQHCGQGGPYAASPETPTEPA